MELAGRLERSIAALTRLDGHFADFADRVALLKLNLRARHGSVRDWLSMRRGRDELGDVEHGQGDGRGRQCDPAAHRQSEERDDGEHCDDV